MPETAKTVRPSFHEAEIDTDRTIVFNHGLCTNLQAKEVRSWYGSQIPLDCLKADKGVLDGVFYAELSEFFTRELSSEGYSGCEVRAAHARTEIIIRATHTQEVLGEKGRRIRELTALVQKRFKFGEGAVELYAEKVRKADRPIGVVLIRSFVILTGPEPWSICYRSVRVPSIQASRWSRCPSVSQSHRSASSPC